MEDTWRIELNKSEWTESNTRCFPNCFNLTPSSCSSGGLSHRGPCGTQHVFNPSKSYSGWFRWLVPLLWMTGNQLVKSSSVECGWSKSPKVSNHFVKTVTLVWFSSLKKCFLFCWSYPVRSANVCFSLSLCKQNVTELVYTSAEVIAWTGYLG